MGLKKPYRILVVDDEPDLEPLMRQRMRRDVRSGKYSFEFAHNGVEALEMLQEHEDIDMVVSDINMPQMDGLTLLEQIPQVDPDIRSIIISAYGDMKNIRTAMNRGAFDFVTKPLDFEDLRVTIDRTLRHLEEWREALASRDKLVALQNELDVASKMQQSILPTVFPSGPGYQVFANMEPARNVGGDFYDVLPLENRRVGLTIADVSDKGVPAALFMMSSRTLMKGAAIGSQNAGQVLGRGQRPPPRGQRRRDVRHRPVRRLQSLRPALLSYASGGHDPPLIVRSDGSSELAPSTRGVALGVAPGIEYRYNEVQLEPGDTAVLFTDGVTEAMNAQNEQFRNRPPSRSLRRQPACGLRAGQPGRLRGREGSSQATLRSPTTSRV